MVKGYVYTKYGDEVAVNQIGDKYDGWAIPSFDNTGFAYLAEEIRGRVRDNYDCVLNVTGDPGNGKSTFGIDTALAVDRDFTLDNICFTLPELLKKIATDPGADPKRGHYPAFVLDEAGVGLHNRTWMRKEQIDMIQLLMIMRKRGHTIILIQPERRQLDSQIRDSRITFWVHIREKGIAQVRIPDADDGWDSTRWWNTGYNIRFDRVAGDLWDAYETRKSKFIQDFIDNLTKVEEAETKEEERISTAILNMSKSGQSQTEIAKTFGITQSAVSQRLKKIKKSEKVRDISPNQGSETGA